MKGNNHDGMDGEAEWLSKALDLGRVVDKSLEEHEEHEEHCDKAIAEWISMTM